VQQTRQMILDYLKEHDQATVDELAEVLDLTTVTVRHHLDILRTEGLVTEPAIRHRTSRGRPQYTYALTGKASQYFPKNYDDLALKILAEIKAASTPQMVNVIFEGVASRFAAEAPRSTPGEPLPDRLDRAVAFLNTRGYVAHWQTTPEGYVLHTCNCPYEALAPEHRELCKMDAALVGNLVGIAPQCLTHVADGSSSCAYLICEAAAPE
jgi:DeoR family transcriptional regulator, suf operon transcriptional repressor